MSDLLSRRTKFLYGIGDTGFSLTSTILGAYFAIFLIDVVGISPGVAAVAIFVGRTWDYINDPLIGHISDRTRTRWGRRRPFLLFGPLPFALAHLPDHIAWRRDVLEAMLRPFREIVDPELVLFAEVDGEPVGWFPGIPNLNEAFIHANGLRYRWDYARLWYHMRSQPECLAIKSVLVPPEYWGRGVAVVLFAEIGKRAKARGYKWLDLSLTSEDNPNTPILAQRMGAKIYKRYRVYRRWV